MKVKKIKGLKIIKRNGKIDVFVPDGTYMFNGKITIINGTIKFIDDGVWTRID